MICFAAIDILWGVTCAVLGHPPLVYDPRRRQDPGGSGNLSVVGSACAGVGSALIAMFTVLMVGAPGGDSERVGFGIESCWADRPPEERPVSC